MSEPQPQSSFTPSQPVRPMVNSPLQRSNYGIPPRQSSPAASAFTPPRPMTRPPQPQPVAQAPTGPRMMDVAHPAPAAQPVAQPPVAAPIQQPVQQLQPIAQPAPSSAPAAPVQPQAPLFAATRQTSAPAKTTPRNKLRGMLHKTHAPLLILGVLLIVGGGVRLMMAGNISGYTVAVGAVTVNDGSKTTIQFTANDGVLHHFSHSGSKRNQIPGTAVQVAYQAGAPDATVKEVAAVKSARSVASAIIFIGVLLSIVSGLGVLIRWQRNRDKRPRASEAVPVTA